MVAPKDVYAVQINNQLKGAVNATLTYSKGMSNELLVEKKHIPAGTSWKSGPYDYQEVRAWVHLGCGGPTWVLGVGEMCEQGWFVHVQGYRVKHAPLRPSFRPSIWTGHDPDPIHTHPPQSTPAHTQGTASFHYVVQAVRVRRLVSAGETPMGVGAVPNAPQESLQLTAPFDNVVGVTPLLEVDVVPLTEDAGKTHLGSLTTRVPTA